MSGHALACPPKTLKRSVRLALFNDRESGGYGFAPYNTIKEENGKMGFNASWDEKMFAHDTIEHSHEHTTYFSNEFSMNIGGEMAAMGGYFYIINQLGLGHARDYNRGVSHSCDYQSAISGTYYQLETCVHSGEFWYGDTLECNVPEVTLKYSSYDLHRLIEEYKSNIDILKREVGSHISVDEHPLKTILSQKYANSITVEKVEKLYKWGFNEVSILIPDTKENIYTLDQFFSFWQRFFCANRSQRVSAYYDEIVVNFYHEESQEESESKFSWTAEFISKDKDWMVNGQLMMPNILIDSNDLPENVPVIDF